MDYWFLDNLDKLVPIIIALLYFIGASKAKGKGEEQEGPSPDASGLGLKDGIDAVGMLFDVGVEFHGQ